VERWALAGARGVLHRLHDQDLSGPHDGVSLSNSVWYGAFVWARRLLDSQKRRFSARAGGQGSAVGRARRRRDTDLGPGDGAVRRPRWAYDLKYTPCKVNCNRVIVKPRCLKPVVTDAVIIIVPHARSVGVSKVDPEIF
jgi:hypothetical protein